jgi:inosine/xanthosine triphosphate pyrophosphatase family protein
VIVRDLAIAGSNPAKAAALKRVASILRIRCARRILAPTEELGPTFEDNAREKALAASHAAPGALTLASDGGLEIPALGAAWNPLRTARFAEGTDPLTKAERLLRLMRGLRGDDRSARWTEALAIATDGSVLASWTANGPRCYVKTTAPPNAGPFWVDGLLERCERKPGHWQLLAERFATFCRQ